MQDALKYAEQIAYSSKEVLHFTYDMAVKYRDSPGIFCECGVAAGAQIIAMAAGAPNKFIYAFDSFEGIPMPSNKDNQMPGIRLLSPEEQGALPAPGCQLLKSSGATSISINDFWNHIDQSKVKSTNIFSIKGWFEITMDEVEEWDPPMEPISILRLDGDLYNSTYVCLKHLYPKVIKGGLVIVDDWALPGCRQAVHDYFNEILHYWDLEFIEGKESTMAYWTK